MFFQLLELLKIRCLFTLDSLVFSLEGRAWQEPEPSHVTGMDLAQYILSKFLGVIKAQVTRRWVIN